MNKEIKSFFLIFNNFKKNGVILALLFFVILGLTHPFNSILAQNIGIPSLGCNAWDLACAVGSAILSIMIKIAVLFFFGIPLLISAMAAAVAGLILGWIISPDFISLKFTQNAFVDIGLSITRGFSNMFFILFLVVIALATVLRIQEYRAKKTLATLIIIALLVNFSSVFCGIIIDFTNVVMDFFLSHITGLNGFIQTIYNSALALWNIVIANSFDVWANIAAAMQILISLIFNWFAAFIFILFSVLFTMRYIMLWILVILAPIAFVSYILPITRHGKSLLNWSKWWAQLIEWSTIGITAGFFLYLGFLMITMINANPVYFVSHPDLSWGGTGLGLANNILPYVIPLILLWIAYKEVKQTSAMFAREIIEIPEKVAKTAVSAAVMAGVAAATAGAGTIAAGMGKAGTAARGLPGAVGRGMGRAGKWARDYGSKPEHEGSLAGTVIGKIGGAEKRVEDWAEVIGGIPGAAREDYKQLKESHPRFKKYVAEPGEKIGEWMKEKTKGQIDAVLHGPKEKEKFEGREIHPIEKEQGVRYKKVAGKEKIPFSPKEKNAKIMTMPDGTERKLTEGDLAKGYVEEERKVWVATDQKLTKEEIDKGHLIEIGAKRKPGAITAIGPIISRGWEQALKEIREKYVKGITTWAEEAQEEVLRLARRDLVDLGHLSDEIEERMISEFPDYRTMRNEGRTLNDLDDLDKFEKKVKKEGKKKPEKKPVPDEED